MKLCVINLVMGIANILGGLYLLTYHDVLCTLCALLSGALGALNLAIWQHYRFL